MRLMEERTICGLRRSRLIFHNGLGQRTNDRRLLDADVFNKFIVIRFVLSPTAYEYLEKP